MASWRRRSSAVLELSDPGTRVVSRGPWAVSQQGHLCCGHRFPPSRPALSTDLPGPPPGQRLTGRNRPWAGHTRARTHGTHAHTRTQAGTRAPTCTHAHTRTGTHVHTCTHARASTCTLTAMFTPQPSKTVVLSVTQAPGVPRDPSSVPRGHSRFHVTPDQVTMVTSVRTRQSSGGSKAGDSASGPPHCGPGGVTAVTATLLQDGQRPWQSGKDRQLKRLSP